MSIPCTASSQRCMGKAKGQVTWFSFGSTHTPSTGTHAMKYFIDVALPLEQPVIHMFCIPPPTHHFNPASQQAFAQPYTHEVRTLVVCRR